MNKSKFLKKSLAALLAILMVAAMIPLSAAASDEKFVGPDGQDTISVDGAGKLSQPDTADESNWTVTLPYNTGDSATIRVSTVRQGQFDVYTSLDGAELAPSATGGVVSVKGVTVAAPKTATIVLRPVVAEDEEPQEDITYKFTVVKTPTSNDPTVTEATYTYDTDKTSKGVISGNKITFTVPWGQLPDDQSVSSTNLKIKMAAQPVETVGGSGVNAFNPDSVTCAIANNKGQITVYAQDNKTTKVYDVEFVEASALKSLTIGGYAAEKDESVADGRSWNLNIPAAKMTGNLKVRATAGKIIKSISFDVSGGSSPITTNGAEYNFGTGVSDNDTYTLSLTDMNNYETEDYTITVKFIYSTDTTLKSFSAVVGGFKENANVSGNRITLTVKKGVDEDVDLAGVTISGELAAGATANIGTQTAGAITGTANLKLGEQRVVVTAEDTKTKGNYILDVKEAPAVTAKADAKIKNATMSYNNKEYVGDVSGKTVTFTIPKSVVKGANTGVANSVNAALKSYLDDDKGDATSTDNTTVSFKWETTAHTRVNRTEVTSNKYTALVSNATKLVEGTVDPDDDTAFTAKPGDKVAGFFENDFPTAAAGAGIYTLNAGATAGTTVDDYTAATAIKNHVVVQSDDPTDSGTEWTIVFKQDDAYTAHALNSITFYAADTKGEVKDENTYTTTKSGNTVTVDKEIPYEEWKDNTTTFVADHGISDRAKLFLRKSNDAIVEVGDSTQNGYNDAGTTSKNANAIKGDDLVGAKSLIVVSEEGWNNQTLNTYSAITARTNMFTEYTLNVKGTPVSDGKDILSLASTDGLVTSVIDTAAATIVLTVPTDYVVKDSETYFDLKIELSPLTQSTDPAFDDEGISENAQVKGNDTDGYKLYLSGTVCEGITVVAEDGSQKYYKLTAQAAELDDDTTLNSISVNGVEAKQAGGYGMWSIVLPYGTDLSEITEDDFTVDIVESATYSIAPGEEENTYIITVTAEDQKTTFDHTVALVVNDKPENPFTDIGDPEDPNNWSASSIITASQNGWILGMGNGKFDPKGQMTRAQFALIIARIKAGGNDAWEEVAGNYTTDVYNDVSATNSYMNAIAYVTEEGIMSGKGAGKFDPNGTITRQEAAKVMAIASNLEEIPGNTNYSDDASIAGWAKGYVNAVTTANIMNGMGAGFSPNVKLTREMGATILVRAFDKAEEPEVPAE